VLLLAACGGGSGGNGSDATAQVTSAYEKFFSGKTSLSDRIALLQNGSKFKQSSRSSQASRARAR